MTLQFSDGPVPDHCSPRRSLEPSVCWRCPRERLPAQVFETTATRVPVLPCGTRSARGGGQARARASCPAPECLSPTRDEEFSVSSVLASDVIHASRRDVPCIFRVWRVLFLRDISLTMKKIPWCSRTILWAFRCAPGRPSRVPNPWTLPHILDIPIKNHPCSHVFLSEKLTAFQFFKM